MKNLSLDVVGLKIFGFQAVKLPPDIPQRPKRFNALLQREMVCLWLPNELEHIAAMLNEFTSAWKSPELLASCWASYAFDWAAE
jgi:hypothetical protein